MRYNTKPTINQTNYEKKLINTSQKFVKADRRKYRLGYTSSYVDLNTTQFNLHKIKKTYTQPNST